MSGPQLRLGPALRYADATTASVWVETSAPAEVEVLGRRARTFAVGGHHYALVVLEGLEPGTDAPYEVVLDGEVVWPRPGDPRPAPRIRTPASAGALDVVFGSCRIDRPHHRPWTLSPDERPEGVGVDALRTLALSCVRGERDLPDLVLMLGDQVYADEGLSPVVRERQIARRGEGSEPRAEVADFEEYTWLYRDSWREPEVRWLLSTVPSAMVFDDHDVRDDWNTSRTWRRQVQRLPWWRARIEGAYLSYWIHQHLGNLSPRAIEEDGLLARAHDPEHGEAALREFAEHADDEVGGRKRSHWSYVREIGDIRIVVIDTRSGRVLEDGGRSMLSEDEWEQVEQWVRGDCEHLLVCTSVPLFLERSIHDLERWNEAVCGGAWGRWAKRPAEALRQGLDLEHWAAFGDSFGRLSHRLAEVAAGGLGAAPRSIVVLAGDVHYSSVAPIRFPGRDDVRSPVVQVVSSPMRNAFPRRLRRALWLARTRGARALGRALVRSVGLPPPEVEWRVTTGPLYSNALGGLRIGADGAVDVTLSRALLGPGDAPRLEVMHHGRLAGPRGGEQAPGRARR